MVEAALTSLPGFMSRHRRAVAAACVALLAAAGWFSLHPNGRSAPPAPATQSPALVEHLQAMQGSAH
jgi:hypothetical protein